MRGDVLRAVRFRALEFTHTRAVVVVRVGRGDVSRDTDGDAVRRRDRLSSGQVRVEHAYSGAFEFRNLGGGVHRRVPRDVGLFALCRADLGRW